MPTDDECNVDEQLDEAQRKIDEQRKQPLIENNRNNTRTSAGEEHSAPGAIVATTDSVTDPSGNGKTSAP